MRIMGNGWEELVNSSKIRKNSGDCDELESQYKQGFRTVETNKILGQPMHILWPNQAHKPPVCNL